MLGIEAQNSQYIDHNSTLIWIPECNFSNYNFSPVMSTQEVTVEFDCVLTLLVLSGLQGLLAVLKQDSGSVGH